MATPLPPKLTPREKRHAKQVRELERWYKKHKQACRIIAKAEATIPRLERQLARYDQQMANAPLPIKAEPVPPAPVPEVASYMGGNAEPTMPPAKPKRKRRSVSADNLGPIALMD